jgi:hypothetical protein
VEHGLELAEYRLLCRAVQDACHELQRGQAERGRSFLIEGLSRASEYAESGTPWGNALADEYRRALSEYDRLAARHLLTAVPSVLLGWS